MPFLDLKFFPLFLAMVFALPAHAQQSPAPGPALSLPPPIPGLAASAPQTPTPPTLPLPDLPKTECDIPTLPKKTTSAWTADNTATIEVSGPAKCISMITGIPEAVQVSRQRSSLVFRWLDDESDPPPLVLKIVDSLRNQATLQLSSKAESPAAAGPQGSSRGFIRNTAKKP